MSGRRYHIAEATALLDLAARPERDPAGHPVWPDELDRVIARAQVHATLALATTNKPGE